MGCRDWAEMAPFTPPYLGFSREEDVDVPNENQETVNFRRAILPKDAVDENTPTTPHFGSSLVMKEHCLKLSPIIRSFHGQRLHLSSTFDF